MFDFLADIVEVALGIIIADVVMSEKGQATIALLCDKVNVARLMPKPKAA